MTEVKDKLVTAESLKNAYDTLNNKSYEKLDVVYNKTNNSLVFQNTPKLPDNVYVDKTLTESGNAADAKVTGDAIIELKNETSGLKGDLDNVYESAFDGKLDADIHWVNGTIAGTGDSSTVGNTATINSNSPYNKTRR